MNLTHNVTSCSQFVSLSTETICFKDTFAIDVFHYKFFSAGQVNSFVTNFDQFYK
jgi:hypothetical protein